MAALLLGLVAALAWGVHDFCVRYVSQRTSIYAALLTVLAAGSLFQGGGMALTGGFEPMSGAAARLAALSGLCFTVASIGLYKAFAVGPVRLVAPVIAAYPVLSVGWAALSGQPVSALQGLAVLVVVAGVAVVAVLSDDSNQPVQSGLRRIAILWSLMSGAGFAATFAIGHAATRSAPELPVILATRVTSIAALLVVMLLLRIPLLPPRHQVPLLTFMGALDGLALVSVLSAGDLPHAEFAAVTASTFGMITILLAWMFLRERLSTGQWGGVVLVFAGIGYLAV